MSYSRTWLRIIILGYKNFWRNRWLTIGATLLMTLTLTMIASSVIMSLLIRDSAQLIRDKIDLTIFFRDDKVSDDSIQALAKRIEQTPHVTKVRFISKNDALEIFRRKPFDAVIKNPLTQDNNPLPRSIQIDADDPSALESIIDAAKPKDTDKIICPSCLSSSKNQDTIDKIIKITQFVKLAGIGLSLVFGLIAIFNVMNIIRITIMARSDEIEIMRFVGASNAFVRGPFIVEGLLYGVLGTLITTSLILLVTKLSSNYINATFSVLGLDFYNYVGSHLMLLIGVQLAVGGLLGVFVSNLSIRRYLKA